MASRKSHQEHQIAKGMETSRKVHELRREGLTFEIIAFRLKITKVGAVVAYWRGLEFVEADLKKLADENRRIELEKLDHLEAAVTDAAFGGGTKAIQTFLKIMERRARLLGLDIKEHAEQQPEQPQFHGSLDERREQLAQLVMKVLSRHLPNQVTPALPPSSPA